MYFVARAIQGGVDAHRDHRSASTSSPSPRLSPYIRDARRPRGLVYGAFYDLVTKAEQKVDSVKERRSSDSPSPTTSSSSSSPSSPTLPRERTGPFPRETSEYLRAGRRRGRRADFADVPAYEDDRGLLVPPVRTRVLRSIDSEVSGDIVSSNNQIVDDPPPPYPGRNEDAPPRFSESGHRQTLAVTNPDDLNDSEEE